MVYWFFIAVTESFIIFFNFRMRRVSVCKSRVAVNKTESKKAFNK